MADHGVCVQVYLVGHHRKAVKLKSSKQTPVIALQHDLMHVHSNINYEYNYVFY